jgi:hypothetical protein
MRSSVFIASLMLLTLTASVAQAQSLSERIADYRRKQEAREAREGQDAATPDFVPIPQRLAQIVLDPVDIKDMPLRQVVTWFSKATQIPFVVNWDKLEELGVDVQTPITLQLRHVPGEVMLALIAQQGSGELTPLRMDVTPWYVELITRQQALSRVVTRIYPVEDLVMEIPRFTGAPDLDLSSALSSGGPRGGSAGGGASGGGNLFSESSREESQRSVEQRGEALAQLIRDTIEPDIWIENGGEHSSCRYSNGKLIVRAPRFVHRQIGGATSGAIGPRTPPTVAPTPAPASAPGSAPGSAPASR